MPKAINKLRPVSMKKNNKIAKPELDKVPLREKTMLKGAAKNTTTKQNHGRAHRSLSMV